MSQREHGVTLERVFSAPRDLVWALVADTNRWDRCSGLAPGRYTWRDRDGRRERFATAKEMGFEIEWIEPPYEWLEGHFVQGERRFLKGPVAAGGFRAQLSDVEGGTSVKATAYVIADGALGAIVGAVMKSRFRRALGRYLDGIDEVLTRTSDTSDAGSEPAVVRARRALSAGYDPVTSGPRSTPDELTLERRAADLLRRGVPEPVATHLLRMMRERPDEEVAQIRPFELARTWQADRRDVLRTFLHATLSGIVDLRWQINCPVCRVAAGVVGSLEEVRADVHCQACNIGYGIDFGEHIEAVFQSNPAIRRVDTQVYCASSPSFLPHVWAQVALAPNETREERCAIPGGSIHVRTLANEHTADAQVPSSGAIVEVVARDDGLDVHIEAASDNAGLLRLVNRTSHRVTVLVERSQWSADAVLGSVIASFPEFLDLFATEAPASGVDLSIGSLALLFSDLTGSTALYQRVGDARAFAIVEEHFRIMERIVNEHDGAIVKTMGDAVMATFPTAAQAVAAALEMVVANDAAHGDLGLGVKLGVHAGPCLAVRANERLDFFGTTVNLAARLQGAAEGGHVVLTREIADEVSGVLGERPKRPFRAALKGISNEQELVTVDARLAPVADAGHSVNAEWTARR